MAALPVNQFITTNTVPLPPEKASLLGDDILRSKGGAMSGVRTLTGFLTSQSGEEFCFAFMVNHFTSSQAVSDLRQRVIEAMAKL